jgi:hypothetical protein
MGRRTPEPIAAEGAVGRLDGAEQQFQIVEHVARQPQPHERYLLWRYSQHLFHSYGALCLARGDLEQAFAYAGEKGTP